MATTYDLSTFHTGLLPGGIGKSETALIQAGLTVGWTVVVKGVTARLVSPMGNKSLVFSASSKNTPLEQYKRIIHKHANPLLVETLGDDANVSARVDDIERSEVINSQKKPSPADMPKVAAFISADEDLVLPGDEKVSDRKLVSIGPMIARRAQGRGYPSETTNQREWSDGSVDYSCQFEGCEYTSTERRSVGAHWRTHVISGDVEHRTQPAARLVIPEYEVAHREGYTPRRERVSALAEVLAILDLDKMSADDLAEFVLNWQHEQSSSGTRLAAEREDLTDGDVLNRIRALLDNGTYLRQRDEIADLRSHAETVDLALIEATERAQAAEDKWTALRELMDA